MAVVSDVIHALQLVQTEDNASNKDAKVDKSLKEMELVNHVDLDREQSKFQVNVMELVRISNAKLNKF